LPQGQQPDQLQLHLRTLPPQRELLCVRYHLEMRELPACAFDARAERTFDRSYGHFASLVAESRL
jgi:hypothetical protein